MSLAPTRMADPALTLGALVAGGAERLAPRDDARLVAEVLAAHVLGAERTQVLAHPEWRPSPEQQAAFDALVARAAEGEPLAYLTGERAFFGLDFYVTPAVLVPRPETETLVELALAARPTRVLDVGTGSGCIAVALAVHLPAAQVVAVDVSPDALAVAERNARRHGVAERVTCLHSDLLAALLPAGSPPPAFDLICANLPYIATDTLRGLAVARHEPRLALDGGPDGLALIRRLLAQAPPLLRPGGRLLLEIGADQAAAVTALARDSLPGARVSVHADLAGLDRVAAVQRPA